MLDTLTQGFRNARLKLQGKATLTEDNIKDALQDVRVSLLEADVELGVVRAFLDRVKERSLGEVVALKAKDKKGNKQVATPTDHFIKICHDELVALMRAPGEAPAELDLSGSPALIMMVGLQGSGKTTTAGKIAGRLKAQGHKPMLVAADIYRPAAIDQLMTLGNKLGVPVFSIKGMKPVDLCRLAVTHAKSVGRDVVIFDTAGRLAIDNRLMDELEQIREITQPKNVLFVCDAMIGQDAVKTAAEFDRRLDFSGFVLTKLDGDARGGAALSIREVTGKSVVFMGMGEGLDKLDIFRPEGLADRILGFGDVVGLMQDFEKVVDEQTAQADAIKMLKGDFTFDDFSKQIGMLKKIGSLRSIFERIPGMGEVLRQIPPEALDDRELIKVQAMIQSMTHQERDWPDLLDDSRMRRISRGSGRPFDEVSELKLRFLQMREMMKNFGQMSGMLGALTGGAGVPAMGMPGMGGGMPGLGRAQRRQAGRMGNSMGLGGMMPPSLMAGADMDDDDDDDLSPEEKVARAKARRADRKARKKGRKGR